MKFTLTPKAKAQAPKPAPLKHVCDADVVAFAEFNDRATAFQKKRLAKAELVFEVCNNLTIAAMHKQSGTLAKLGDDNLIALSEAMGVSVEALNDMTPQDFSKKALELMPAGMIDASQEAVGEAILVGAFIAGCITAIASTIYAAGKVTTYEIPWLTREAGDIIRDKGPQALKELGVNSWSAKQLQASVKACYEVLKVLELDQKKIYDPKFKVVELEKIALKLWAAPTSQVVSAKGVAGDSAVGASGISWTEWRGNIPEKEFKTLGEHGWTMQSLTKFCEDLKDLCKEIYTMGSKYGRIVNGKFEAMKPYEPGFFGKVKRFFTESIEDREKRKQEELIINAKFLALRNILWGFDYCVRIMCGNFYDICNKMEKYIVAEQKKASAASPAKK